MPVSDCRGRQCDRYRWSNHHINHRLAEYRVCLGYRTGISPVSVRSASQHPMHGVDAFIGCCIFARRICNELGWNRRHAVLVCPAGWTRRLERCRHLAIGGEYAPRDRLAALGMPRYALIGTVALHKTVSGVRHHELADFCRRRGFRFPVMPVQIHHETLFGGEINQLT